MTYRLSRTRLRYDSNYQPSSDSEDSDTGRGGYFLNSDCDYINTVLLFLPTSLARDLKWLIWRMETEGGDDEFYNILDRLFRFISGGPHWAYDGDGGEMNLEKNTEANWKPMQTQFRAAIREVHKTAPKGPFDWDEYNGVEKSPSPEPKAKRRKIGDTPSPDDTPKFTLHSVSTTSPIRKKVDITVHKSSIQFTNPATHEFEASVPISCLKRAFVVPSQDTAKRQWTVVLMSTDYVEPKKKRKRKSSSSENSIPPGVRVIFKIDKNPTTKFETTNHTSSSSPPPKVTHDKSSDSYPHIHKFINHLPKKTRLFLNNAVMATAKSQSSEVGTIWLTKESGILWNGIKSHEFWAMEDISAVRTLIAGKTFSVYVSRRNSANASGDGAADTETTFTLSVKYRDGVDKWVNDRKALFAPQKDDAGGRPEVTPGNSQDKVEPKQVVNASKSEGSFTINNIVFKDNDDEDDEDFEMDSDDGSSSSGELSDCVTEDDCDMNVDEGHIADDEQDGLGVEKAIETEKARDAEGGTERTIEPTSEHPLLQPGASMPKEPQQEGDGVEKAIETEKARDTESGAEKAIEPTSEHPLLQQGASMPKEPQENTITAIAVTEDVEMGPPLEEKDAGHEEGVSKEQDKGQCQLGNGEEGQAPHVADVSLRSAEQTGTFTASQEEEEDEIEEEIDELDD